MTVTQLTRTLSVACTLVIGFTGCGGDDPHTAIAAADSGVRADDVYLGVAQPESGFRLQDVGAQIAPGEDVEYCELARIPDDQPETFYASRFELGNADHSHHLIVSAVAPGSPAEEKAVTLGEGERETCFSAENYLKVAGVSRVAGSQAPYHDQPMPQGVGMQLHAGQYLVFDYHYLNTTDADIDARSVIGLHLVPKAQIEHIASEFGFRNYTLAVPPNASGSYSAECHFKTDVMLGSVTRHTHRWGTEFSVEFAGGARDGQHIWSSQDWQHDNDFRFDQPVKLSAGDGLRFRCDFENTTERMLHFGTSATDEMCILFGVVWSTEDGHDLERAPDCSIVWLDDAKLGHPADEAGGFPAPDPSTAASCHKLVDATDCSACRCDACGSQLMNCIGDSDCLAAITCYQDCPSGQDCDKLCQSTLDQHSSGIGPFVQMNQCFDNRCDSACAN